MLFISIYFNNSNNNNSSNNINNTIYMYNLIGITLLCVLCILRSVYQLLNKYSYYVNIYNVRWYSRSYK